MGVSTYKVPIVVEKHDIGDEKGRAVPQANRNTDEKHVNPMPTRLHEKDFKVDNDDHHRKTNCTSLPMSVFLQKQINTSIRKFSSINKGI